MEFLARPYFSIRSSDENTTRKKILSFCAMNQVAKIVDNVQLLAICILDLVQRSINVSD